MYKLIVLTIIVNFFTFCEKKEVKRNEDFSFSPSKPYLNDFNNRKKINNLFNKILIGGDTIAYKELKDIYVYSGHGDDFLYCTLIMANNFNYSQAYFDAYIILKTDKFNSTNIKTNKLANYYLLRAHENDVKDIKFSLKERFGDLSNLPKADNYWLEINK